MLPQTHGGQNEITIGSIGYKRASYFEKAFQFSCFFAHVHQTERHFKSNCRTAE